MNNSLITKARYGLIRMGKVLPFVVCGIVCISYIEDIYALLSNNYMNFADGAYLSKSLSWFIGNYFTYDIVMLFVLVVLSIAIETCYWNKLACLYLGINLLEKSYFDFELEPTTIYIICTLNMIIAGFLTFRGLKILLSK
jgi:hypothetical protein